MFTTSYGRLARCFPLILLPSDLLLHKEPLLAHHKKWLSDCEVFWKIKVTKNSLHRVNFRVAEIDSQNAQTSNFTSLRTEEVVLTQMILKLEYA